MSIPFLCCTILSPLIGLFVDKYGERITLMMISCFLVFFGLLSIMFFYPIYGMLQLGIGYAFFGSTIWTSITFVVPEDKLVNKLVNKGYSLWSYEFNLEFCLFLSSLVHSNNIVRSIINNSSLLFPNPSMYLFNLGNPII